MTDKQFYSEIARDTPENIDKCLNCTKSAKKCNGECLGPVAVRLNYRQRKKCTDGLEEKIIDMMLERKMTNGEIAKALGIGEQTIYTFRKQHGIPAAYKMRAPKKEQIEGLLAQGYSLSKIGKLYDMTGPTIKKYLTRGQEEEREN